MTNGTCSDVTCDRSGRLHRGLCGMHYQRVRKSERALENPCAIQGCGNDGSGPRMYCKTHEYRFLTHGDPLVTGKGKKYKVLTTLDGLRVCKLCEEPKPLTEFHRDKNASDGYRAQCKPCRSGYMSEYYLTVADERREYIRVRRLNNPEHVRALESARYIRNRETRIELACENVRVRRARLAGAEREPGVTVRALRKRDGDKCCYCDVGLDFTRAKRGQMPPNRATLEHILPISRGGGHTFANTALACHRCNTSKNHRTLEEWLPTGVSA